MNTNNKLAAFRNNVVPSIFYLQLILPRRCKQLQAFCQTLSKPTFLVLDNAPVHKTDKIMRHLENWQQSNLYIFYLPPYSPSEYRRNALVGDEGQTAGSKRLFKCWYPVQGCPTMPQWSRAATHYQLCPFYYHLILGTHLSAFGWLVVSNDY